jgi:hypothetical protein
MDYSEEILVRAVEDTGAEVKTDENGHKYIEVTLYHDECGNQVFKPHVEVTEDTLKQMFERDLIKKISVSMEGVCNEINEQKHLRNRESRRKEAHKRTVGQTNKSVRGKRKRKKRSKQRNK